MTSFNYFFRIVSVCVYVCMCVFSHSVVFDSLWPHGLYPTRLLCPWKFSRQEYWSGQSFSSSGDLPEQGSNLSLMSPALAGGFFTFSITWEASPPPRPAQSTLSTSYSEIYLGWGVGGASGFLHLWLCLVEPLWGCWKQLVHFLSFHRQSGFCPGTTLVYKARLLTPDPELILCLWLPSPDRHSWFSTTWAPSLSELDQREGQRAILNISRVPVVLVQWPSCQACYYVTAMYPALRWQWAGKWQALRMEGSTEIKVWFVAQGLL